MNISGNGARATGKHLLIQRDSDNTNSIPGDYSRETNRYHDACSRLASAYCCIVSAVLRGSRHAAPAPASLVLQAYSTSLCSAYRHDTKRLADTDRHGALTRPALASHSTNHAAALLRQPLAVRSGL